MCHAGMTGSLKARCSYSGASFGFGGDYRSDSATGAAGVAVSFSRYMG